MVSAEMTSCSMNYAAARDLAGDSKCVTAHSGFVTRMQGWVTHTVIDGRLSTLLLENMSSESRSKGLNVIIFLTMRLL